jgi:triacylglycerol lipase
MLETARRALKLLVGAGFGLLLGAPACGSADSAEQGRPKSDGAAGQGGEHAGDAAPEATADAPGDAVSEPAVKLGPPYPIVLAHGFFGFEEFAGVDFATYFYGVKEYLAAHGETQVTTPAVDPFNDSTYRGEQLLAHVQQVLEQTGYAKVNIIGHSQGGLDARVVAFERPDLVASVTTVATPHWGTPVADVILKLIPDPNAQKFVDWLVKIVGAPLYDQVGKQTALSKPLMLFSKSGIADFNAKYTDRPGVEYFSIAGRSDWHLGGPLCAAAASPPFIAKWKTELDPVDPLLSVTETYLDGGLLDPYPNDGLVRVKDAQWGTFLGCIPADHLDEIGHLFGDAPGLGNAWRHDAFYAELIAYLRQQGL